MARINSRQVEAFRAMMLTGSVTEAARLMAVTQPAAREIRGRRTGTLRVAAMPALANESLPRLAGHFLKERPNLNLAFFGVISPIVVDWVMNNQCDVGFAEVPIAHSGLLNQRLP